MIHGSNRDIESEEIWNGHGPVGNTYFLGIRLRMLKEATNMRWPYIRLPGRHSQKETPEYKSGVLPLRWTFFIALKLPAETEEEI
jgi:hypothetical protein